jgi:hypothetical protein
MIFVGLFTFGSCSKLDVIGTGSVKAFDEVLNAMGSGAGQNGISQTDIGWARLAPDGEARFVWSDDYSGSARYDAAVEFQAQPFINAGLDPDQLPDNYIIQGDQLVVGTKFGDATFDSGRDATAIGSYELIVGHYREAVGYHTALDHYGVSLGDGNMFEWAKDMKTNDKDIVFVLNPEPLIDAGANPEQVDGWVYAKVPVMVDGKASEVYKLLKPFDLQ